MNAEQRPIRVAIGRSDAAEPATAAQPAPEPTPAPAATEPAAARSRPRAEPQTPLIDIHEGPEGLVLEADLPGATQETVTVQLEDNVLMLHAQPVLPQLDAARLIHEEFRSGDFQRSFILSDEVDRTQIVAEMKNGVLRLHLPRAERAKARRIEIKS